MSSILGYHCMPLVICKTQVAINSLIGKRCDFLLWFFIVRKVLLVLLPVGTRGAGHGGDAGRYTRVKKNVG